MTYLAYELSGTAALNGVASLCRHAARAAGSFDVATIPSLGQVESWLTESYYWIGGQLRRYGFDEDQSAAGSAVISILQQLQVYDTCCKVELSLPAAGATGEPNARFQTFIERREELLGNLHDGTLNNLSAIAETKATSPRRPIVTGLSKSDKKTLEDDTDATQHRIRRDEFLNPGTLGPLAETDWVQ